MSGTQRSAFWRWRHARPFWGGLLVTLGGAEILVTMKAPLPVILHVGMTGVAGYLIPVVILVCGVLLIVSPGQRLFYSLVGAVCALGSWITSNLGGFIIGLLLALVGSALAFAWSPDKRKPAAGWAQPNPEWAQPEPEAAQTEPIWAAQTEPEAAQTDPIWAAQPDATQPGAEAAQPTPAPTAATSVTPGVQPETSHRRPRHSRTSPGSLSGE